MHSVPVFIDVDEVVSSGPLKLSNLAKLLCFICVAVGTISFLFTYFYKSKELAWGSYYTSLLFFTGLSAGSVIITAIFQITRAMWSPPVRRIAEANVAFLPVSMTLLLVTYFGKEILFPWARHPRPGSEMWMQADFVYLRFIVLLSILFYFMWRLVRMSLKPDIALAQAHPKFGNLWVGGIKDFLGAGFKVSDDSIVKIQNTMSRFAPLLIAVYGVVYSLFAFEMVMAMDHAFMSNLFGAFLFAGNIYIGWAYLAINVVVHAKTSKSYGKAVTTTTLWDVGKLTFGFCMVWGYFFFSQFLPIWYGNLPEETQWMILRLREYPWKLFAYFVFGSCFIVPFIMLLSDDIKKTPLALSGVALIVLFGVWLQYYLIVIPQFSPGSIPFGLHDIGIFCGFLGLFVYVTKSFLGTIPWAPITHPLSKGSIKW
jgi:hypothetical protein